MASCPICNGSVASKSENTAFPFCSARCKTIDLGKWLSEDYRVPASPEESLEDDLGAELANRVSSRNPAEPN